jgi:hypothetical protein
MTPRALVPHLQSKVALVDAVTFIVATVMALFCYVDVYAEDD